MEWRIHVSDIPLVSYSVAYSNGDVCDQDKLVCVDRLIQHGVVRELNPSEKKFFTSVLFLRKLIVKEIKIRKVVDFRELSTYSEAWRSEFPSTVDTFKSIPLS